MGIVPILVLQDQASVDTLLYLSLYLIGLDLKLMKSVWGAHVRTPEEDELSEECICEPPRVCLCCH